MSSHVFQAKLLFLLAATMLHENASKGSYRCHEHGNTGLKVQKQIPPCEIVKSVTVMSGHTRYSDDNHNEGRAEGDANRKLLLQIDSKFPQDPGGYGYDWSHVSAWSYL
jgi:hypothetical protein